MAEAKSSRGVLGRKPTHPRREDDLSYNCWQAMIARCYTENHDSYPRYGGRGITVCERWRNDFWTFRSDMGPRPSRDHSIDRIENDGNYEPSNCRWATRHEQQRKRTCCVLIAWNGDTKCAAEWAAIRGITKMTMRHRLRNGWTMDRIMTTPNQAYKRPRKPRPSV